MTPSARAIVLFGDVVDSRLDAGATAYLRSLRADLDAAYPRPDRLAAFGFTQGDELQGLLAVDADPFVAVARAALRPDARAMRWAIVVGAVEEGSGPATERTGPAFHAARDLLAEARTRREGLVVRTGDPAADALLDDIAPLGPTLLDDLTARQREVGRLILLDGLRRSEAAGRLQVSRATVSVIADRGRIRQLGQLMHGLLTIFRDGVARSVSRPQPAADGSPP